MTTDSFIIFGKSTSTGADYIEKYLPGERCFFYSRNCTPTDATTLNLDTLKDLLLSQGSYQIVSFIPIWHLSSILSQLCQSDTSRLKHVTALFVCSSTSALTKRFSHSPSDYDLALRLVKAEESLTALCNASSVRLTIVRPTMIYGYSHSLDKPDANISIISRFISLMPLVILPSGMGTRQPIHFSQLSRLFSFLVETKSVGTFNVGGDLTLSPLQILHTLRRRLATTTLFIILPKRLFLLFSPFLALLSESKYSAFLRLFSHLSGFTPVSYITGDPPRREL